MEKNSKPGSTADQPYPFIPTFSPLPPLPSPHPPQPRWQKLHQSKSWAEFPQSSSIIELGDSVLVSLALQRAQENRTFSGSETRVQMPWPIQWEGEGGLVWRKVGGPIIKGVLVSTAVMTSQPAWPAGAASIASQRMTGAEHSGPWKGNRGGGAWCSK